MNGLMHASGGGSSKKYLLKDGVIQSGVSLGTAPTQKDGYIETTKTGTLLTFDSTISGYKRIVMDVEMTYRQYTDNGTTFSFSTTMCSLAYRAKNVLPRNIAGLIIDGLSDTSIGTTSEGIGATTRVYNVWLEK